MLQKLANMFSGLLHCIINMGDNVHGNSTDFLLEQCSYVVYLLYRMKFGYSFVI